MEYKDYNFNIIEVWELNIMIVIKVFVLEVNMFFYIMVCLNLKIKKIVSRFLKIYVII